jgi:hypothetical protein
MQNHWETVSIHGVWVHFWGTINGVWGTSSLDGCVCLALARWTDILVISIASNHVKRDPIAKRPG